MLMTIKKQKWLGNQPTATYSTACKCFPPLAVPELYKENIDKMNKQAEALAMVKGTTVKEICEGLF
eukprot:5634120-Ditylum_brightwellii.AAC.1